MSGGSFRSPAQRASDDIETFSGPPLKEGEWIRYWAVFPHGIMARVTSEATDAVIDTRSRRLSATFDAGKAAMVKVRLGIVDWNLLDESGEPVRWDASRADELLDGLSDEVYGIIGNLIDSRRPGRALGTVEEDGGADLGEASDEPSTSSSTS